MFNSPVRLAATAAGIGAIANTLRLEMVDMTAIPPAGAAFVGALTAGILASLIKSKGNHVPRSGSVLVCISDTDYCRIAAGTDICKDTDR